MNVLALTDIFCSFFFNVGVGDLWSKIGAVPRFLCFCAPFEERFPNICINERRWRVNGISHLIARSPPTCLLSDILWNVFLISNFSCLQKEIKKNYKNIFAVLRKLLFPLSLEAVFSNKVITRHAYFTPGKYHCVVESLFSNTNCLGCLHGDNNF